MGIKQKINWKILIPYLLKLRCDRQSDFGNRFGVKQQSVSNWITGYRTPNLNVSDKIVEYCKGLGINPQTIGAE